MANSRRLDRSSPQHNTATDVLHEVLEGRQDARAAHEQRQGNQRHAQGQLSARQPLAHQRQSEAAWDGVRADEVRCRRDEGHQGAEVRDCHGDEEGVGHHECGPCQPAQPMVVRRALNVRRTLAALHATPTTGQHQLSNQVLPLSLTQACLLYIPAMHAVSCPT